MFLDKVMYMPILEKGNTRTRISEAITVIGFSGIFPGMSVHTNVFAHVWHSGRTVLSPLLSEKSLSRSSAHGFALWFSSVTSS